MNKMLKHCFLVLLLIVTLSACQPPKTISEIHFADDNFAACVKQTGIEQFAQLKTLDCSDRDIKQADEIKYFTALTTLNLSENELTDIDVSHNQQLQRLEIWSNVQPEVRLGQLPQLRALTIDGDLQSIDLSDGDLSQRFPALTKLSLIGSPHSSLAKITVRHPRLSELSWYDLGHQPDKVSLKPGRINLKLDTPALKQLDINNPAIGQIKLSPMPALASIMLEHTQQQTLTLNDLPQLNSVIVDNNALASLTLQRLPALTTLSASVNQLTTLTLTELPALQDLRAAHNRLTELDLASLPSLRTFNINDNYFPTIAALPLKDADLKACISHNGRRQYTTEVTAINCRGKLAATDLSPLTNLQSLQLVLTDAMDALDLSSLQQLQDIRLSIVIGQRNRIGRLILPKDSQLNGIDLNEIELQQLTLPSLPHLTELRIASHQLQTLTLPTLPKLKKFVLYDAPLTDLSIAHQPQLTELTLAHNGLKTLALIDLPQLKRPWLGNNLYRFERLTLRQLPQLDKVCMSGFDRMPKAVDSDRSKAELANLFWRC